MCICTIAGFPSGKIASLTNDSSWNWHRSQSEKYSTSINGTYCYVLVHKIICNIFVIIQVTDTPVDAPLLPESQSSDSLSSLKIVSDPRKKATTEGDEVHSSVPKDSSMVSLRRWHKLTPAVKSKCGIIP